MLTTKRLVVRRMAACPVLPSFKAAAELKESG